MIRQFFKKTFDIRDGEIYISFLMQLYIFLIISVLLIVKPSINALFLSNLGADHLPYGYLAVAITAVVSSYFYNNAIRQFSIKLIATITLIIFSLSFLILSGLLYFSIVNEWVLYFFYINVSLFAVLATSQFWIFANLVYNVREAKRLFGFIGAGGIAGGIFGGYLTSIFAPLIGNRGLILIAALLILGCVPILQSVWRIRVKKLNTYIRRQRKESDRNPSYQSSFRLILRSKHLIYLASIVGVSVMMAKLVDFQFSDFANKAIANPDSLASFFGFWFSSFNVIALLIQLFLTNRILSYIGVTSTLMILPLGIALGCLLFLTFPELWVLIIIKGMDGSFKQSINKAATELSILPIPFSIKNQAKSYIDVVVDSLATGISGFLLIFVIRKLDLSTSYITIIIISLLFLWIVLIYQLREAYFNSFRMNLQKSVLSEETQKGVLVRETTTASANRILTAGSDDDILALLMRLDTHKIKSIRQPIIALLDHDNNQIKAAAIKQLYSYDRGTEIEKIKKLIEINDDKVVLNAMQYLILHTDLKDSDLYNSYLDHPSMYISRAALICLAKESASNSKISVKYKLNERIDYKVQQLEHNAENFKNTEIGDLLILIAHAKLKKYYSFINLYLQMKQSTLANDAIRAAGIAKDPQFIATLLEYLSEKKYRRKAIKALKKYGTEITNTIYSLDVSENLSNDSRRFIPKVIEVFKTQDSVKMLLRLLNSRDIVIRLEASKSLLKLKLKDSELLFNQRKIYKAISKETIFYKNTVRALIILQQKQLLHESLEDPITDDQTEIYIAREALIELLNLQLEQSLLCVFKLLSLQYDKTDMHVVYSGLVNSERDARINAIEFLDNILHIKLKSTILPILEYQTINSYTEEIASLKLKKLSEKQCLQLLMKNRGKRIKLASINLIQHTKDLSYLKVLNKLKNHQNKEVKTMSIRAIEMIYLSKLD